MINYLMQPDSLSIFQDSSQVITIPADTLGEAPPIFASPDDSSIDSELPEVELPVVISTTRKVKALEEPVKDTTPEFDISQFEFKTSSVQLYSTLRSNDSSTVKVSTYDRHHLPTAEPVIEITPNLRVEKSIFEKEWVFGISMLSMVLIILVQIFYQKYLASIFSALGNMQLSEKMMREKNVIVRRVFFFLNTIYFLALALLAYTALKKTGIRFTVSNDFHLFMIILAALSVLSFLRVAFIRFIAVIFDAVPVFREYVHNTFIINKSLGIILLPLIISSFYVDLKLAQIIFVVSVVVLFISLLYRYIKAIQIILKHNVFLFYSILYLCTLEILPVLVGIKFVLTQR
jgi:hypothetical protein